MAHYQFILTRLTMSVYIDSFNDIFITKYINNIPRRRYNTNTIRISSEVTFFNIFWTWKKNKKINPKCEDSNPNPKNMTQNS